MSSESSASTGFYEFLAWAEENRKNVIIGILAALAIAAVLTVYFWRKGQTEIAANTALLQLRAPADAAPTAPGPAPSEYLSVADRYSGTDAADRALLLAAGALFTEGNYAEAGTRFEQFLRQNRNHQLAAIAAYGVASSLEAQGKPDQALTAYQDVVSRFGKASVADDAKVAIARIHVSKNQPEQALKSIEGLTAPTRPAGPHSQAMALKDEILAKHPELAKVEPAATQTNLAPTVNLTNAAPQAATQSGGTAAEKATAQPE